MKPAKAETVARALLDGIELNVAEAQAFEPGSPARRERFARAEAFREVLQLLHSDRRSGAFARARARVREGAPLDAEHQRAL